MREERKRQKRMQRKKRAQIERLRENGRIVIATMRLKAECQDLLRKKILALYCLSFAQCVSWQRRLACKTCLFAALASSDKD